MLEMLQKMKRYRKLKTKPGELKVYYGKLSHDDPGIIYSWGEGIPSPDVSLVNMVLSGNRIRLLYGKEREEHFGASYTFDKSFIDELDARGFDITTFKFSIQKKTNVTESEQQKINRKKS